MRNIFTVKFSKLDARMPWSLMHQQERIINPGHFSYVLKIKCFLISLICRIFVAKNFLVVHKVLDCENVELALLPLFFRLGVFWGVGLRKLILHSDFYVSIYMDLAKQSISPMRKMTHKRLG